VVWTGKGSVNKVFYGSLYLEQMFPGRFLGIGERLLSILTGTLKARERKKKGGGKGNRRR